MARPSLQFMEATAAVPRTGLTPLGFAQNPANWSYGSAALSNRPRSGSVVRLAVQSKVAVDIGAARRVPSRKGVKRQPDWDSQSDSLRLLSTEAIPNPIRSGLAQPDSLCLGDLAEGIRRTSGKPAAAIAEVPPAEHCGCGTTDLLHGAVG